MSYLFKKVGRGFSINYECVLFLSVKSNKGMNRILVFHKTHNNKLQPCYNEDLNHTTITPPCSLQLLLQLLKLTLTNQTHSQPDNLAMSRNAGAKDGGVAPSSSTNVDGSLEYSHNDAPYPIPDFTIDEINEMNLNRIRDGQDNDKNSKSASCASTDQLSSMVSSSRKSSPHSLLSFPDRKNIWSMMTRRRNMLKHGFDFDDEEQEHEQEELQSLDRFDTCKAFLNGYFFEIKHCVKTLCKYPYIYISSALVFAALAAVGLIVVAILCSRSRERDLHEARWEALESATWFSEMFAKSLIPLRSLQQAVVHSEYFKNLPHEIGNYGQPGSAQPIFGLKSTTVKDYRNVTGICDNQEMIDKFEEIVAGINENFDYDGIIVNYRLAPYVSLRTEFSFWFEVSN